MPAWTQALVTGASSGIGESFARELAADGTDVVLVARSGDVLETLAEELRTAHRVEVEVLVADLTDEGDLTRIADRLRDQSRPIELLVNNAGFGNQGNFHDLDAAAQDRMIQLNLTAVTVLAHAAIPNMTHRGRGGILNVSSMVALMPFPSMAVYAATKAYVLSFSEALHEELAGQGITVTCLNPGFTETNFVEAGQVELSPLMKAVSMQSRPVARAGLDGLAKGRAIVSPGTNAVLAGVSRVTPSVLLRKTLKGVTERQLPSLPSRPAPVTRERALITGASRGLGAEFARQLAAGGTDLVLAARTESDLTSLADELREQHGVEIDILLTDLNTSAGVETAAKRLAADDKPVDLFVNNAGLSYAGQFADNDLDQHLRVINVNVRAATALAHAATRAMVSRGNGSVINVASVASFQAAPGMAIYSASKMYVRYLSEASHEEVAGTGVRVLALCPGYTRTDIFEAGGTSADQLPSMMLGEPAQVIATALRRLDQPGATTVPVWYNRVLASTASHLPRSVVRKTAKQLAIRPH